VQVGTMILRPPFNLSDELGLIYKTEKNNILSAKMTWKFSDEFIEMCGGLTQVLGKALVDVPDFARYFNVNIKSPVTRVGIKTDVGLIPVDIEIKKNEVNKILTDMTSYVKQCYQEGVKRIKVLGIDAMKVGEYLVINGDDIKKRFPRIKLEKMDKNTLSTLDKIQKEWYKKGYTGTGFSIYDLHSKNKCNARAVFPHNVESGYIEPTCGTGTVAIGIALLEKREVGEENGSIDILFETGGEAVLGGPDISELKIIVEKKNITKAYFSHSLVKILATGEIWYEYG